MASNAKIGLKQWRYFLLPFIYQLSNEYRLVFLYSVLLTKHIAF